MPSLEDIEKEIVKLSPIPIVADIHFHYLRAIEAADAGAACLRINPGNIGNTKKVKEVISAAKLNETSIRIGVNAGSLERDILEKFKEPCPEALVESALRNINILENKDFIQDKSKPFFVLMIILRLKKSYPRLGKVKFLLWMVQQAHKLHSWET